MWKLSWMKASFLGIDMLEIKRGNIFKTECKVIVNTVNCVGVMGAGIAYEFRLRYPGMFLKYQQFCDQKMIDVGKLWIYKIPDPKSAGYNSILNFPTKTHWKYPSKISYIEDGLEKFVETYKEKNISSIAFPLLGVGKGGLDKYEVLNVMKKYLSGLDVDVEIWEFDPLAKDDVFEGFKIKFLELEDDDIKRMSKIRIDGIKKIKRALQTSDINSMSGLLQIKGIGEVTLEKAFEFVSDLGH